MSRIKTCVSLYSLQNVYLTHEMNLEEGKISLKSPIGAALMGKKAGDIVEVKVPAATLHLRIDSVTVGA